MRKNPVQPLLEQNRRYRNPNQLVRTSHSIQFPSCSSTEDDLNMVHVSSDGRGLSGSLDSAGRSSNHFFFILNFLKSIKISKLTLTVALLGIIMIPVLP